jgi:hypothetical protein
VCMCMHCFIGDTHTCLCREVVLFKQRVLLAAPALVCLYILVVVDPFLGVGEQLLGKLALVVSL